MDIVPVILILFIIFCCFMAVVTTITRIQLATTLPDNKRKYEVVLRQLKNDPNNSELRMEARRLGKWLVAHSPLEYSEHSLTNDLIAALGTHPGMGVMKVEVTNMEKLRPVDTAAQVEKLGQLFLKGVITAEEFERGKALFLGSPPDVAKKTMETLDDLYRLQQKGALSEGEYNMKKWDLLAGKLIK